MFQTFRNAWKSVELRKKILYTLLILIIFRIGCTIPVPFVEATKLAGLMGSSGNILNYMDALSGGALSKATLFALSIQPYINSSIIMQLLTYALPPLERLQKEGEEGKLSKREQREIRLASYKDSLEKLEDRLKGGGLSDSTREKIEGLRDTLKGKITKLEAKLSRGGKKVEEKTLEPKKDPWANKGYGMPRSNGKKLFEGLTKEQQASVLDRYMKESESMLRQETMNPDLVIGAIEEFLNDSIYETDDVAEVSEELKVSKNEAQAIIRHALGLEIKRLKELPEMLESICR